MIPMAALTLRRGVLLHRPRHSTGLCISAVHVLPARDATSLSESMPAKDRKHKEGTQKKSGKWFTLPPYKPAIDGSALGKALSATLVTAPKAAVTETTALKWVIRCCPEIPRSLVQKLFRLRQVRREYCNVDDQAQEPRLRRVAAKDSMNVGDRIFLPITVQVLPSDKQECNYKEDEVKFMRSLVLFKDSAIIVVNKPPGMPVQGGFGITRSLDELAAACLSYDYSESARLSLPGPRAVQWGSKGLRLHAPKILQNAVHRLDRDSSGILVMGRTQTSTTILHSIFREKTFAASTNDVEKKQKVLRRHYWALVVGTPRHPVGMISAPLGKVVVDGGKSDRITVVGDVQNISSQHAVTQYRVIASSSQGYTWLELCPLTGRKHQLRVHCAEVLGTPIVGDYKYGWQVHRSWKCLPWSSLKSNSIEELANEKKLPFGLDLESGSICERQPRLHLHCKQMVLPNVSKALQRFQISADFDFSQLQSIKLDAPLPSYMQRSWDILSS